MHPIFILAFVTFLLIAAFLVWNVISTKRHKFNADVAGPGGSSDPLSGKTEGMRHPDEMRAAWDAGGKR